MTKTNNEHTTPTSLATLAAVKLESKNAKQIVADAISGTAKQMYAGCTGVISLERCYIIAGSLVRQVGDLHLDREVYAEIVREIAHEATK